MTTDAKTTAGARTRLLEATALAGLPAAGYLLAFVYEAGYAYELGIPVSLIRVGITEAFIAAGATLILLLTVGFAANLLYLLLPKSEELAVVRYTIVPAAVGGFIALAMWLAFRDLDRLLPVLIIVGAYSALIFLLPLLTQRKVNGYIAKLEKDLQREARIVDLGTLARRRFGPQPFLLVSAAMLTLFVASSAGQGTAFRQTMFPVMDSETVILRIYGDRVVSAHFDRTTKMLDGRFVVTTLGASSSLTMSVEDVGPLRKKKDGTS